MAALVRRRPSSPRPTDGYTFLYGDLNTIILTRAFDARIGYDPIKDLVPVVQLGVASYCVVISSTSDAKSVKHLVEQSRTKGAPLRFASPFSGSTSHLYAEMLTRAAGVQMIHLPQKGSALQALSTIRENRADVMFDKCGLPGRAEGFFVSLAATGKERSQDYPNIPTLGEEGYPIDLYEWIGIFAPAGTAKEIVERMATESSKIVSSSEERGFFRTAGVVVTGVKSDSFLEIIKHDAPRWAEVIRVSGA